MTTKNKPATIKELSLYKLLMGDLNGFVEALFRSTIKQGTVDLREIFAEAIGIDKRNIKVDYCEHRYTISFPAIERYVEIKIDKDVDWIIDVSAFGKGFEEYNSVIAQKAPASSVIYSIAEFVRDAIKKDLRATAKTTKARLNMMLTLNIK